MERETRRDTGGSGTVVIRQDVAPHKWMNINERPATSLHRFNYVQYFGTINNKRTCERFRPNAQRPFRPLTRKGTCVSINWSRSDTISIRPNSITNRGSNDPQTEYNKLINIEHAAPRPVRTPLRILFAQPMNAITKYE